MKFQRLGKATHPVIQTARDLEEACALDEALWVATSAPVHAFRMDPLLLTHLDSDADTRIKCGELQEAVAWTRGLLQNTEGMEAHSSELKQSALSDTHPEAEAVKKVIRILSADKEAVTLEGVRAARNRLEQKPVSEAGVILPDAAEEETQRKDIEHILSLVEGAPHPSGRPGLNQQVLNTFAQHVNERREWRQRTRETDELGRSLHLPLGEDTAAAFDVFTRVRERVDHFFQLCEASEMAPETVGSSWPGVSADLDWHDADQVQAALRKAPLAPPNPERILKINRKMNPAWRHDLHCFRQQVLIPLLDRTDDTLTEDLWSTITDRLAPYETWSNQEPHPELASLTDEELERWADSERIQTLIQLCEQPVSDELTLTEVRLAEKLALYQANLIPFANNFIAFPYLYDEETRASFEMGTLIMDGRRFNLAVKVPNRAEYIKSLTGATMFVMIIELVNPQLKQRLEVAVPATSGQQGNLKLGKHGVFEHVDGTQWFATVVHIQDNPISFAEAVFEPFKRLGQAVTRKIESLTQAAEKKLEATGGEAVTQLREGGNSGTGGMLAGGGIAVAALGSSLAYITKIFAELSIFGVLQGLLAAILAVLIPGSIIAGIRLSKRDLSVLLEGADWAVNSRMRLNSTQRRSFTEIPPYPKGSTFVRPLEWWLWRILWILVAVAVTVNGLLMA